MYSVIIPCAGLGSRMKLGYNKILFKMGNGKTVIENTVDIFIKDSKCNQIVLVAHKDELEGLKKQFNNSKIELVLGGSTRQESVYNGLKQVMNDDVLIHDGARPYLKQASINELLVCLNKSKACLLMVGVKDTVKIVNNNLVSKTLDRSQLMLAQTPQAFKKDIILKAYQKACLEEFVATDDCSLVEHYQLANIQVVLGDYGNIKITTMEDIKEL